MSRLISFFAALAVSFILTGCVGVESSEVHHHPSIGQRLIDLKLAHDKGVIDDAEYEMLKHEIMQDAQADHEHE